MKAAIYARVSTERQLSEGKTSMEDQLARCRAVCEAKGWEIVEVYDEGDASAGTAHRSEFQRLIADCKAGKLTEYDPNGRELSYGVIVVREVSRLSRVAQARRAIEELMVEWGISVLNAKNGMLYSESEGLGAGLIWHIEAKMAEAEWLERSHRTNQGMFGKARQGIVPGSKAPFGYRWAGGQLEVEQDEADVVTRIFKRIAAGATCATVARELDAAGVPSPARSARGWWPATVFDIATRSAYIGRFEYGRQRWVRLNSERDRQAWAREYTHRHGAPPSHIPPKVRVPGDRVYECECPAIVTPRLWNQVSRHLSKSRKGSKVARRQPMLLGLLRCEECGREMRATWAKGRSGKEHYFYRCGQAIKDPARFPCRVRDRERGLTAYVNAGEIEGLVWQLVDRMLSDRETLERAIGLKLAEQAEQEPSADSRLARHEKRLAATQRAWDGCRRAYFAGDLDDESFARDRTHYERELAMLREEIERMHRGAEERARQRDRAEVIRLISASWPAVREALTEEERARIVRELVTDVTVSREDEVTVSGKLLPASVDRQNGSLVGRTPVLSNPEAASVDFELVGRLAA